MPVILQADITVVVSTREYIGRNKRHTGTIEFGNGVDSMPPDGLPVPSLSQFGFIRQLIELRLSPRDGSTPLNVEYQAVDGKILFKEDADYSEADGTLQSGSAGAIETPLKTTLDFVAIGF